MAPSLDSQLTGSGRDTPTASGVNSPEPRSTSTPPPRTSTIAGRSSSLPASMTTRPPPAATFPIGCQPTFHSSISPLASLIAPRCHTPSRAQEAMRCSPSRTSKWWEPSCQAASEKVARAGCRGRVRRPPVQPSRFVPRRGKPSVRYRFQKPEAFDTCTSSHSSVHRGSPTECPSPPSTAACSPIVPSASRSPTCSTASSHGMPGWSQVIHARCSPSGDRTGEVTKSVPATSVRTGASSRAAEPSRGMATSVLTGSPPPRWSSLTA